MISILLGVSVLLWVCSDICGGSTIPPGGSDLSTTPAPPHSNLSFPASQDAGMPLSDARIQCQVSTTEAGPDYTSCLDAFSSFQSWDDHVPGIIGRRGTGGNYAHNLPWRWISRDGHCTFDVVLRGAAPFEEATGVELARSAWKLMNECVRDKGAIQGIASGIGRHGDLGIIVRKHDPSGVRCFDVPEIARRQLYSEDKCDHLVSSIVADVSPLITWGPPGVAGIDEIIPKAYETNPRYHCRITVFANPADVDTMTYYDLWQAGAALRGMCARFGKGGTFGFRGTNRRLAVTIGDGVRRPRDLDATER